MSTIVEKAFAGRRIENDEANLLAEFADLPHLMQVAGALRDRGHGAVVTYSRKVFIPLTHLCRDVCGYCTFAKSPKRGSKAYLSVEEALDIACRGAAVGCKEALFTLGDKPEQRWREAAIELAEMGFPTTLAYLAYVADRVRRETGLLPHLNPGVMTPAEMAELRRSGISMGLMLETASERLSERGGPHHGSPDKHPTTRLACIGEAGALSIPFTSGLLIGIGETRRERIESLIALRELHERYGHLQEVIIQNFAPKIGTKMARAPAALHEEHIWTIAVARLLFGPSMNIQAPPNLSVKGRQSLIDAGINDWGGVSPITVDHVNPEAAWPEINKLAAETERAGKTLVERLAIYPSYALKPRRWVDAGLCGQLLNVHDAFGFAREDDWSAGVGGNPAQTITRSVESTSRGLVDILSKASDGVILSEAEIISLFAVRGKDFHAVCNAADAVRKLVNGPYVSYVVNRNINYTNVCIYACKFCAFSKGKTHAALRGKPYDLDMGEFERRVREAWARGASEVCLQGGIHPDYTGETYLNVLSVAKSAAPEIHIHAFSPLEIWQGASSLGLPLRNYLTMLKGAGLGSVPGTAAEILDDEVRAVLCPDKLTTAQWFEVMEAAHSVGLRSTATIMFGHVEGPQHWARHLLRIRAHQERTGGFTEFVPLPFVAHEAPIYLKGSARRGPTWREAILMHAISRLVLHPVIRHVQASWVKLGRDGARTCLMSGANDLGGTLMNESISRAAGSSHGQELAPPEMTELITAISRVPRQRTTLYGEPSSARVEASFAAGPLAPVFNTPLHSGPGRKSSEAISLWQHK